MQAACEDRADEGGYNEHTQAQTNRRRQVGSAEHSHGQHHERGNSGATQQLPDPAQVG